MTLSYLLRQLKLQWLIIRFNEIHCLKLAENKQVTSKRIAFVLNKNNENDTKSCFACTEGISHGVKY